MDTVLSSDTLGERNNAGNEIIQTQQRSEMLKSFINVDNKPSIESEVENSKKPNSSNPAPLTKEYAKKSLGQMLERHPDIAHDPTYAAAANDEAQNNKAASPGASGAEGSKKRT